MDPMKVLLYPDEVLRSPCRELTKDELGLGQLDGTRLDDLADRMVQTMLSNGGVGLAAPQVGLPVRMFVAKVEFQNKPLALLNPVIKEREGKEAGFEGCLSLPGLSASVERSAKVVVMGTSPKGEFQAHEFNGFEARVVEHEMDHLDGVVFIQRLSEEDYSRLMRNVRTILENSGKREGTKDFSQNNLTRWAPRLYDRGRRKSR